MWLKTQDKKTIVNAIKISIDKAVFSGKNKAALIGKYAGTSLFSENHIILGYYKTVDEAMKELSSIEECIRKNEENIYTVK